MWRRLFQASNDPGFRVSLTDALFIVGLVSLSWATWNWLPDLGLYLVPVYVGGTFFLFCNLFRIRSRYERIWYMTFVPMAVLGLWDMERFWWWVLPICEPLKVGLILWHIFRETSPYKGIFWRQVEKMREVRPDH